MNVDSSSRPTPEASWWEQPEIRSVLAARDAAGIFGFLKRRGVSQRCIAGLTGLAVSEIYEVLKGRRIMAYDVLCRIADGLQIPRGYMGLAFDPATQDLLTNSGSATATAPLDDVPRLLSHAAAVTLGIHGADKAGWKNIRSTPTPLPALVGAPDIAQIEAITASLRALDYQHGGGACREAVLAQARWVVTLLHQDMDHDIRRRLHVTLADLYNLAGWTSFDVGLSADARAHFGLALVHAQQAGEPSLTANILYRIGRLHLHDAMVTEALRYFQLGQIAAHDAAGPTTAALLCANEAWAYGILGNGEQARRSLGRAEDELSRIDSADHRPWISFFGGTDLTALAGMMHLELASHTQPPGHLDQAEEKLVESISGRGEAMPRSRALELAGLAVAHFFEGNTSQGLALGHDAVDLADRLRSVRVWQRFMPLAEASARVQRDDAAALSRRIHATLGA